MSSIFWINIEKAVNLRRISKAMEHVCFSSAMGFDSKTSKAAKPHRKMTGFEPKSNYLRALSVYLALPAARLSLPPDRVFYFDSKYFVQ